MCLVLAWNTGFAERYVAPRLSHHKHDLCLSLTPSSLSSASTHIISVVASATALYSASVLDLDTVACFLAFQEIRSGPKNTAKPPVDLLSSGHPAQSAYEKALSKVEDERLNVRPIFKVPLMYLK